MRAQLWLLAALAMSVGWGFRGDYGHGPGAMVPGALVALAIALASGRSDWCDRASLLALLGALGWAFGGTMSYALVVGYTMDAWSSNVAYGFACLFVVGAVWGGTGAGVLALGITRPRRVLERSAGPLLVLFLVWTLLDGSGATGRLQDQARSVWEGLHWSGATGWLTDRRGLEDTSWVEATSALLVGGAYALADRRARPACGLLALLGAGWWLGFGSLTLLAGLRMTPPRSDNWAGCVGLLVALIGYLCRTGNHAAVRLTLGGAWAGGVGFAVGDFVNVLGRGQWGPIGRYEALHGLDYWKWMEQLFGLLMGLGVACGFDRAARRLATPHDGESSGPLRFLAPLFLLVVMMWQNLFKNVRNWARDGSIREPLFGVEPWGWFLLVGVGLSACVVLALVQHGRRALPLVPATAFGRAQLLFLLILWVAVLAAFMQAFPAMHARGVLLVHTTFWLTAIACTLIVLVLPEPQPAEGRPRAPPQDWSWLPGWGHGLLWLAVPLLILLLAGLAVRSHERPASGSQQRFEPAAK